MELGYVILVTVCVLTINSQEICENYFVKYQFMTQSRCEIVSAIEYGRLNFKLNRAFPIVSMLELECIKAVE